MRTRSRSSRKASPAWPWEAWRPRPSRTGHARHVTVARRRAARHRRAGTGRASGAYSNARCSRRRYATTASTPATERSRPSSSTARCGAGAPSTTALEPALDRPIGRLDPPVRAALRLGAYQLLVGVADHAAVGETVEAAPRRARGVRQRRARQVAAAPPGLDSRTATTPPPSACGCRTPTGSSSTVLPTSAATTRSPRSRPATSRRRSRCGPNPRRTTADAGRRAARRRAHVEPRRLGTDAVVVRGARRSSARSRPWPRAGPRRRTRAARRSSPSSAPEPGDAVLDTCRRAGGQGHRGRRTGGRRRAGRRGRRAPGRAGLVAAGRRPPRPRRRGPRRRRRPRASRSPARASTASSSTPRAAASACSGAGPRRAGASSPSDAAALGGPAARARSRAAAAVRRPGGTLVYSVCTLTRDETIGVDEWVAADLPELVALSPPGAPWRPWGRGALLLPARAGTDGMFVLRLRARPGEERPVGCGDDRPEARAVDPLGRLRLPRRRRRAP